MSVSVDNIGAEEASSRVRNLTEHCHSQVESALLDHAEIFVFAALSEELNGDRHERDVVRALRFGSPSVRDKELQIVM